MATVNLTHSVPAFAPQTPFVNEPFVDFTQPENKRRMQAALADVQDKLGREYDIVIGGKRLKTSAKIFSMNPARPAEVIGVHQRAGAEHVEPAMQAAQAAFTSWSKVPVTERADLLFRAAALIRERSFEFCAWLTFEVGKNWAEADADVGETIDFLEFYGREALRLEPGEDTDPTPRRTQPAPLHSAWRGRRHSAVELPVRHHGRHDSRLDRLRKHRHSEAFSRRTNDSGKVHGATRRGRLAGRRRQPLPRRGRRSSAARSSRIRRPASSPSPAPRPSVSRSTSAPPRTQPGQIFIKRTILEMGGKDSIIVEPDCDIDAALDGVVASAFGFNGQKCSACSRAIVVGRHLRRLLRPAPGARGQAQDGRPRRERLHRARDQREGPTVRCSTTSKSAKKRAPCLNGGHAIETPDGGYYIAPTVIADVAPTARIALEEIFGPVLAVIKSHSFDDALAIANNTEYGLTGAIYTSSREKLDRARDEFYVGNLYFNRKCTGAMVGAHPFGGFNMSGTDSKAGGPDYLLLFTQAKSVAEKIGHASPEAEKQSDQMGM